MFKLFRLLILLALVVGGIGLYRGWFQVASQNTGDATNINVTVDKEKMREDTTRATHELKQLGQEAKDKATATTQPGN
jgi:hypothetical protein